MNCSSQSASAFCPAPQGLSWDPIQRRLYRDGVCFKRCHHDAHDQLAVLKGLQADGWPRWHIDPLPSPPPGQPDSTSDRVTRLRNTIKRLNRGQHPRCLHFCMRVDGAGLRWVGIVLVSMDLDPKSPKSVASRLK